MTCFSSREAVVDKRRRRRATRFFGGPVARVTNKRWFTESEPMDFLADGQQRRLLLHLALTIILASKEIDFFVN